MEYKVLRVSGKSPVKETAGSIVKTYESGYHNIELHAIGASSVNQMYKAMATSASILAGMGLTLMCKPGYSTIEDDAGEKTIMVARLIIQ